MMDIAKGISHLASSSHLCYVNEGVYTKSNCKLSSSC